jgi:hypothetical protein
MKKLVSFLFVIVFTLTGCTIATNSATFTSKGFKYKTVDGGVEITGYSGKKENLTIPNTINGQKVVSIGKKAFYESTIRSAEIGNNVKIIKDSAFESCYSLYEVNISDSVEEIGKSAFSGCGVLDDVKYGNSIKKIGKEAFAYCEIKTMPSCNTLEYIGDYAFTENFISKLIVGKSLKHIGKGAFYDTVIKTIDFNKDNKYFTLDDKNVLYNASKTNLVLYPLNGSKATSYTVHSKTKEISPWAFECSKLKKITLPESVTEIGEGAFDGCMKLSSINLPKNLKEIKFYTFYCCEKLKTVKLGANITKINECAFINSGIESIKFPKNLQSIGKEAFCRTELKKVKFNKNLKSIGKGAFSFCNNLKTVKLNGFLKTINEEAFEDTKVEKLNLTKRIKNINYKTFGGMQKLKKITVSKSNKFFSASSGALYNKKKTAFVYYPLGLKKKTFKLAKSTRKITHCAFYDNKNIREVKFNKKLRTIGQSAFSGCKKLSSLTIPKNIRKIGTQAFADSGIESLYMNSDKLTLGDSVLWGCANLKTAVISKFKSKGGYTFAHCDSLSTVVFKKKVTTINKCDFLTCESLTTITIPKSVKKIGKRALGYYYILGYEEDYGPYRRKITINGYKGTAAEKYAKKNKFKFVALKK